MSKYTKVQIDSSTWVITEKDHNYKKPVKACTFAFDTETQIYFKGKLITTHELFKKTRKLNNNEKRTLLKNITWSWQVYDEFNGFFMTNNFYEFLAYQCRAGLAFGWCYNSTFDFSQIDYEILATGRDKWKPHEHARGTGKAYNKGQAWTYESLHSDMGARYAYKLWVPYRHINGHDYTHAIEYRDFMKLVTGGLGKLLEDLNVVDNDGKPIRKLKMEYQQLDPNNLTEDEIDYCCNDVKGLYFAIKQFNETIEGQSAGECHIFGYETNIMTAGGFAKRELLRSLYPNTNPKARIKLYQKQHPITLVQDQFLRSNGLYRGGIVIVNPKYKGKLINNRKMYRYDVNSEYPYAMAQINDLIGKAFTKSINDYLKMSNTEREKYEAVYVLNNISGIVKPNCIGVWYDPYKKAYVDIINENNTHLIFERELNEMLNWYDDLEYNVDKVILFKKGKKAYKKFVEENYELKAEAKKAKNKTLQAVTKLKLNSSYGKLAERIERIKGHYELNEETGAIHFIREGEEISTSSVMNVAVGALVTCVARCYILRKIREVCKGDIVNNFIYIDTDSIHCFNDYDKADAYALGGLKLEAICDACKYIAPKTYIDIEKVNEDLTINYDAFEIHSKGVNLGAIKADLKRKQKYKKNNLPTLKLLDTKIAYGAKYICLVAMNVQGGKVLIPTEKYLARLELAPDDDGQVSVTNYMGAILTER